MRKIYIGLLMAAMLPSGASAQRMQQKLGRSVVAVANSGDVLVTWRKLAQEPENCTYNLYKRAQGASDYTRVNAEPIGKTNYQASTSAIPYGTELAVTVVAPDGTEGAKSNPFLFERQAYNNVFFDINFETAVLNPDDYRVAFVRPMDLDGNGEYDAMLVDRLCANKDKAPTDTDPNSNDKLQLYTLDGKCLWTIDAGPNQNFDEGQNDKIVAYDINCDGKCEVIIKSTDGTRFWNAAAHTWGKYANGSAGPDTDGDGIVDYTKQGKRNPPFYISVVDGRTGEEMACSELDYSEITDGVDTYTRDNRADYFDDNDGKEYAFLTAKFAVCYFDGIHPSLAVQCYNRNKDTGHHYYVLEWKYDWNGGKPSNWHHSYTWPMKSANPPAAEFHQFRVADVDGDGIDEIMEGGYAVNPVKGLVMSPGIGHGDRFDVSDIDPERPGLEVYAIQQTNLMGQVLYDAATGEHIKEWYLPTIGDVGRGRCIDVDPDHKGYEVFSTMGNLYDCKGNVIKEGDTAYPVEAVWWDGDLQRELLSSSGGSGYATNVHVGKYSGDRLIQFSRESDWAVHAGNAVRPGFMGDMTGDWREELILLKQDANSSTGIIGYSTNIPTDYSLYTLQEDPHYRLDCTTRGYYQMPCTGFYLGGDMPYPPLPPTMVTDLRWQGGQVWGASAGGFTSFDQTSARNFADGESVVFDISGQNAQTIQINSAVRPSAVYIINPKGHDYAFAGTGTLAGNMELWKSQQGMATIDNDLSFTGRTVISEGTLCLNGTVAGPVELRAKGTLAGVGTLNGDMAFEEALNYEGCRIMPGHAGDRFGTLTFGKSLTLPGEVYVEVCVAEGQAGKVRVNGDLTLEGTNTFTIDAVGGGIPAGRYVLAECTGTLTADPAAIRMRGTDGLNCDITVEGKQLVLTVNDTRAPQTGVVWTGNESNEWNYKADNFVAGSDATPFVANDAVVFNDESANRNITVSESLVTGGITFDVDNGTYSFAGDGSIGGKGGLTKNGRGEVRMELAGNNYTGPTVINGGTLTVTSLADGGKSSSIGASTAEEGNLQLRGGTLKVEATNMATDHIVTLEDTSTVCVASASGTVSLKGLVKGDGYLVKDGPGQLNFTYGGVNPFAGLIVRQGTVATGAWNATLGKPGSPMVLAGGTVDLLDVNQSSTRPEFNYKVTVVEGTDNTIMGTTRGDINGSFTGKGNLTIVSDGVRNDIGADFSKFEGTLTAQGENFRLQDNVTDMGMTSLVLAAGARVGHYNDNGGNTRAVNTAVGSVASTATDCNLGNGIDSYEVGRNNSSTKYAGRFTAKTVTKRGGGILTISGTESTSDLVVAEGALDLYCNPYTTTPTSLTSGTVTVNAGARVIGHGGAGAIVVNKGGVIAAGYDDRTAMMKSAGSLTLGQGSTIVVRLGLSSGGRATNDSYKFTGAVTHNGDTVLVEVPAWRTLAAGDEFEVFVGEGVQSGSFVIKTDSPGQDITWDCSDFLSKGLLRVATVDAIEGVAADAGRVDVYSVDGIKLRGAAERDRALDGLAPGVYVVGGRKIVKD